MNSTEDRLLEAGPLRVRFFRHGDRFAHEISLLDGQHWTAVWASLEGTPQQDWPASPPFQSLHIDQRDDGRLVALLVGMAGKSHWSASVEIDAAVPCVSFDVACRVHTAEPGPLGSTYRKLSPELVPRLALELGGRYGPAVLQHDPPGTTRVAAQINSDECSQTIRWDYRLRLTGIRGE